MSYNCPNSRLSSFARTVLATIIFSASGVASAYVGDSFLQVPGLAGPYPEGPHQGWVKFEAEYWGNAKPPQFVSPGKKRAFFSGPIAPRGGAGTLALALNKKSPALQMLMSRCLSQAKIPEMRYAESSELARTTAELGPRPDDIPEFFEYTLKGVELSCPVVSDAPEQAFILKFDEIQWRNYHGGGQELRPAAAKLIRDRSSGDTQAFIVTWFANATDVSESECPKLNAGPVESDVFALLSAEDAAKEKVALANKDGTPSTPDPWVLRGPNRLNVCELPGVAPDPGFASPQSNVARGFNLDGDDGTGKPPRGIRRHQNYLSEDGHVGIDNQLFSIEGCIPGLKSKGLLTVDRNELMRNGAVSMLVEVSGLHNVHKNGEADIAVFYSKDPMVKNAAGSQILRNYTFRLTDDPELTEHFIRVRGRLENGVIVADPIKEISFHDGGQLRLTLYHAQLRITLLPDGTIRGLVGGYQDWREIYGFLGPWKRFEQGMGFTCPGLYNALKRAADGLQDPVSGEFNGISAAYDFEGVPAFIPPAQDKALLGGRRREVISKSD